MQNKAKEKNLTDLALLREGLYKKPVLCSLFFELTDACNMSCLHCGSCASPHRKRYLDFESIKKVALEVSRKYNPRDIMICLTGGEPMLHPDFYKIASFVTQLGFMCGITTNATFIDKNAAQKIKESGICSVAISLDGTQKNHDKLRNKEGAFVKTIEGISNLVYVSDGKITTQVTTVVSKNNISELEDVYELVCDLNVDSWRVINIEPIGRAKEHEDLLLDEKEFDYLLDYIRQKRFSKDVSMHVTYGCSHYLGEKFENETRDHYFMCGSGITVASVLCNGDIYSCLDIERRPELVQGNIHKDSFVDVWENKFKQFRTDRTMLCKDCQDCPERYFCKGDSAHTWDYDNNRPMLCYKNLTKEQFNEI